MKWKIRLADHFSWLRAEKRREEKLNELIARDPWLRATSIKLIEQHKLDEPFIGHVFRLTFPDGSIGYLAAIFEPALTETENGSIGHGYPSSEVYGSVEEAKAEMGELLQQALTQWTSGGSFLV